MASLFHLRGRGVWLTCNSVIGLQLSTLEAWIYDDWARTFVSPATLVGVAVSIQRSGILSELNIPPPQEVYSHIYASIAQKTLGQTGS